jgi:hypothetical protein
VAEQRPAGRTRQQSRQVLLRAVSAPHRGVIWQLRGPGDRRKSPG